MAVAGAAGLALAVAGAAGVALVLFLALVPVRISVRALGDTATPDDPVRVDTVGISTFGLERRVDALLSASPSDKVRFEGSEVYAKGSGDVSITASYGSLRSATAIYASTPVAMEVEVDGKRVDGGTLTLVRGRSLPLVVRTVDGEGKRSGILTTRDLSTSRSDVDAVSVGTATHGGVTVPELRAESDGRSRIELSAKGLTFELRVWSRVPTSMSLAREIRVPREGRAPVKAQLYDRYGDEIGDPLPDSELGALIEDTSIVTFSSTDPVGLTWKGQGTTRAWFSWGDLKGSTTLRGLNSTETLVMSCLGPPIDATACQDAGWRYANGYSADGIAESDYYASRYLGMACRGGETATCSSAAYHAMQQSDYCTAKEFAQLGCDANEAHACGNLGVFYANEKRCAYLDYGRAATLYRKACNAGENWFCGNLYILAKHSKVTLVAGESLSDLKYRGCTKAQNKDACI